MTRGLDALVTELERVARFGFTATEFSRATQTMMRKGSSAITPGVARIQVLPAIEPSKYATREELMAAVRSAIAEALPPEMKPVAI